MKTILAITQHPLTIILSTLFGTAAMAYLQEMAVQSIGWFIPVLAIVIADLAAGVRASRCRKEEIRVSSALRRTGNKLLCYGMWIVCCVALNERYSTSWCAWLGMGIIFAIEAFSFVSNIIEPHGLKLSITGILKTIGKKHGLDGLEDVVEKEESK